MAGGFVAGIGSGIRGRAQSVGNGAGRGHGLLARRGTASRRRFCVPEYRKCVEMRPDAPELRSNLGAALAHLGRYADAVEEYQRALRLAPENPGLRLNMALAYYKAGEIVKALPEFESLHREQPEAANVLLLLSDCYLRTGESKRLITLLEPLESQHRDDPAFSYLLGMALIRDGQVLRGQAVVDRILRSGDSGEAHYLIGTAAFMNRNFATAAQELQKAIALNPEMPSIHSWYGQALLETGDPDGAAVAFRKELESDPTDFEANARLGQILSSRRQFSEAEPYLRRAVQVRPGSAESRFALAKAYEQNAKPQDSRHELEALVVAVPDFGEAHALLAKVDAQLGMNAAARRERGIADRLARTQPAASETAGNGGLLPPGSLAPAFTLPAYHSDRQISLTDLGQRKPVIVMFGSYTSPQFRSAAGPLNLLYERFSSRAEFLLVYVHEAHTGDNWQSTVNSREGVDLGPEKSSVEKQEHAALCGRKLNLRFPVVVDGMERTVESAYSGPARFIWSAGMAALSGGAGWAGRTSRPIRCARRSSKRSHRSHPKGGSILAPSILCQSPSTCA
ncbi:MAG: tetratricopeptide repeat protein [Bryobacteraceae bacterium]